MTPEWISVALEVIQVLETLRVPYCIGGSGASTIHGVMRATIDCDLVADLQPEQVEQFTKALKEDFYIEPESIRQAIANGRSFNVIHQRTIFKIDIFMPGSRKFEKSQLARRTERTIAHDPELKAWIASAEDTVLAKLYWFRLGNEVSERQWRDVLGVLKTQSGCLDLKYMHEMAITMNIVDLLDQALEESAKNA